MRMVPMYYGGNTLIGSLQEIYEMLLGLIMNLTTKNPRS